MRLLNLTLLPFNSTMVRLKDEGAAKFLLKNSFQFHYGTIKRIAEFASDVLENNFNSTMVRLKDGLKNGVLLQMGYFNSTMVRLKERQHVLRSINSLISIPLWYD